MRFESTPLPGLVVVELEPIRDERGFFARAWCKQEFEAQGLDAGVAQCSFSHNVEKGTVRGMHRQVEPHAETKVVRVTQGAAFDVAVDARPDSPTFKQWFGVELSAENGRALYVPEGFLHGFQTLVRDTVLFYQITAFYHPECDAGARYDDPAFGIEWPLPPRGLSPKDLSYGPFDA